jgi:glycerol-3-phosphate O-acyltransferase / dihydroxyacetone phosphate acyltransferase
MWLYRAMPLISELAVRSYYRVSVAGARIPTDGPVLLVANHNNSLVDPALVAAMAGRNVRFLAKATLFTHPLIGWLIKGVGSVPVYRQQDDPKLVSQNLDTFRDVHRVLASGDMVGIFPEGISHSASRLAPLKTGAARIAIGAAAQLGTDFPIIAVGLVFRDRDAFRSEAHVIIGESFRWDDLVGDLSNRTAVRELTDRIERSMRRVSVNLEAWEDEPLVRTAEAVWRAEFGAEESPAAEVERLRITTEALQALRAGSAERWRETAVELKAHGRALKQIGLTPETLVEEVTFGDAARWLLKRLLLLPLLPISILGAIFFWIPKQLTVRVAGWIAAKEGDDAVVTHRVLLGGVVFPLWIAATSAIVWTQWGWMAGVLSVMLQPVWAFAALAVGERRQVMWTAVRRYLLRRMIGDRLEPLRERQISLATKLSALLEGSSAAA